MGLLGRFREAASGTTTIEATLLEGDEGVAAVGESHYLRALKDVSGRVGTEQVRHPVMALLIPEPSNPYDAEAISIHVEGRKVGYLSREDARAYGPLVRASSGPRQAAACRGRICGREGTPNLGVWLELPDPYDAEPS
jgi:hypothetical protein